jgi:hypothetical protein
MISYKIGDSNIVTQSYSKVLNAGNTVEQQGISVENRGRYCNSSITFRLKNQTIGALKKQSEEEGISLNNLVTKVLDSYLEWECVAPKVGFIPMQKFVLRKLFDSLSEESIKDIAIAAADIFKDEVLMMRGKVDLDAILSLTKGRVKRSGFGLSIFDDTLAHSKKIIIQHEMGHNWSIFATAYHQRLINNIGYSVKTEGTDNSITIEIFGLDTPVAYSPESAI